MKPEGISPGGRSYRLAICDDKKLEVSDLKLFLSSRGFSVQSFPDARLLVDHIKKTPGDFDLILLDIVMPVLDGYAAFHEMKETGRLPRIMFLSVENSTTVIRALIEAGAVDYIVRPADRESILDRIKKQLSAIRS